MVKEMTSKQIIFWIALGVIALVQCEDKDDWVEPHAWGLATKPIETESDDIIDSINSVCVKTDCQSFDTSQKATPLEKAVAIYYKKMISFIFSRSKMEIDPLTKLHSVTIQFKLNDDELAILEKSTDPRDWDGVLSTILRNSRTQNSSIFTSSILSSILDSSILSSIKHFFLGLMQSTEVRFTLIVIAVGIALFYFKVRHKYGIICTLIFASFLFGFLYTYYNCNRKREIQELINIMDTAEDPCESYNRKEQSWFWGWFSRKATKEDCIEFLKKKNEINLPFCRPDEVLLTYVNEIIINQFKTLAENITIMLKDSITKMPFPYNIALIVVIVLLLPIFMKMMFKYIFSPMITSSISHAANGSTANVQHISETHDRVSGANLRALIQSLSERHATIQLVGLPSHVEVIQPVTSTATLPEPTQNTSENEQLHPGNSVTNPSNEISRSANPEPSIEAPNHEEKESEEKQTPSL